MLSFTWQVISKSRPSFAIVVLLSFSLMPASYSIWQSQSWIIPEHTMERTISLFVVNCLHEKNDSISLTREVNSCRKKTWEEKASFELLDCSGKPRKGSSLTDDRRKNMLLIALCESRMVLNTRFRKLHLSIRKHRDFLDSSKGRREREREISFSSEWREMQWRKPKLSSLPFPAIIFGILFSFSSPHFITPSVVAQNLKGFFSCRKERLHHPVSPSILQWILKEHKVLSFCLVSYSLSNVKSVRLWRNFTESTEPEAIVWTLLSCSQWTVQEGEVSNSTLPKTCATILLLSLTKSSDDWRLQVLKETEKFLLEKARFRRWGYSEGGRTENRNSRKEDLEKETKHNWDPRLAERKKNTIEKAGKEQDPSSRDTTLKGNISFCPWFHDSLQCLTKKRTKLPNNQSVDMKTIALLLQTRRALMLFICAWIFLFFIFYLLSVVWLISKR